MSYRFLGKHWIDLWGSLPLRDPKKEQVVRWPHVAGYPWPEQEMYLEGSYSSSTSSVVRREVLSVPGKLVCHLHNMFTSIAG